MFPDLSDLLGGPGRRTDEELALGLLDDAGVACVPGSAFGAPGHLRLSYATSLETVKEGVRRLAAALG